MKNLPVIILFLCINPLNGLFAQKQTEPFENICFYLVRHAEKDTGKNPGLTQAGLIRAGDLFRKLQKLQITDIFVSQWLRTQMTADSLRIYQHIDTIHYRADLTGDDLISKINSLKGKLKNVLIIGHSNTIPSIIRRLEIKDYIIDEIPDKEYDNLYRIKFKKKKAIFKQMKYGKRADNLISAGNEKMKPLQ